MGGDRRKLFVALFGFAAVGLFLARPSSGGDAEPERRETSFIRVGRHYVNVEQILYAVEEEDGGWGVVLVLGPGEGERFKLEKVDAAVIQTWIDRRSFGPAPIRSHTQLGPPIAAPHEKSFVRAGRYYINTKRILHTTEEEGGGLVVVFGAGEENRLKLDDESEATAILRWVDRRSFNSSRFPAKGPQQVDGSSGDAN